MELQLINKELSESKLYRLSRQFKSIDGQAIANLLYLHTLALYLLSRTENYSFAKEHARKTAQYGPYTLFRTYATDLYMLAYQVNCPDNDHCQLNNERKSKEFLNSLKFDNRYHWRIIHNIGSGKGISSKATNYFCRLEAQLKIKNSRYRKWRREAIASHKMTPRMINKLKYHILWEIKRQTISGGRLDIVQALDSRPDKNNDTLRKTVGAVAGAAAGTYVAKKFGKPKKIGAGLGAIAGFWAAKRR